MTAPSTLRAALGKLFSHSLVYGAADVFTSVVNLLLVPLFTTFLTTTDYGHLALLMLFGTVGKIVFRLGLDAGFFRIHYEMETDEDRRRLAGTVAAFAAAVGAALFVIVLLLRRPLTRAVLGAEAPSEWWVVLVAADLAVGTVLFVPLAILRIQDRPRLFSSLSTARHVVNTVLKVVLVAKGQGISGILWSDLAGTAVLALCLAPILAQNAARAFATPLLREVLRFGLPKVPHGVLVQVLNVADRKILDLFVTRAEVGVYQLGYTFGTAVKFASSAFEPAWAPFVYSRANDAEGRATLGRVSTYAFAGFLLAGLATAVLGPHLLRFMTPNNPAFWSAAALVPVVALAYVLHGLFLLTSIGIGISKKARYYPLVTLAAAVVNIAANLLLIPRMGVAGAAWATVLAYAVMAAVGALVSRRLVAIPYETARMTRLALLAAALYSVSRVAPAEEMAALVVGGLAVAAFPALALVLVGRPGSRRDV